MNKPTAFATAAACALVLAGLIAAAPAAQATEADGALDALDTDAQLVDCLPDTESHVALGDDAVLDDDPDCYILGLDGVDEGVSLDLPDTSCDGTEGPVAGLHFPAGTPTQFFPVGGDEPVAFGFTCATDEITCFELSATTSKTGGGEASATSECSQTSAHCESPPGDKCADKYVGLNEPGPWHCHLYVHVKWYGGSAHASCSATYS